MASLLNLILSVVLLLSPIVEKAVETYNRASSMQASGEIQEAHILYRSAADVFVENQEDAWASVCYYSLAISYLNQRDTIGMDEVLQSLQQLQQRQPDNISINFDYYSVLATRMVVEYENTNQSDSAAIVREQMMCYQKLASRYLEQMSYEEQGTRHVHPVWTYYNIAVMYDLYYEPIVIDSIRKYLDLAQYARDHADYLPLIDLQEADISINDERAWLAYHLGNPTEAKLYMQKVLTLIDTVAVSRPNAVLTERGEAYQFMAMLAEEEGNSAEALAWQKKLNEANRERFDIEQNKALHEVEAKYKKREQDQTISSLRKQNILLAAVSASLLLILCAAVLIYHLRRKNREQEQYEKAVEAALPIVEVVDNHAQHISTNTLQTQLDLLCHDFPCFEQRLRKIDLQLIADICSNAEKQLSVVDLRYLICFLTDLTTNEIADMFSVEPSSIYIARYRLRRKFPPTYTLPI